MPEQSAIVCISELNELLNDLEMVDFKMFIAT